MGISNSRAAENRRQILAGVRGGGTTGDVFYVDSGSTGASDTAGRGKSPGVPFATMDFAVTQCAATNGDMVILMPGHAETISDATSANINVAGVHVIGLGRADDRPTFTFDNTSGEITIDADDCTLENVVLINGVVAQAIMVNINNANSELRDVLMRSSGANTCTCWIDIATTVDFHKIIGCDIIAPTDPASTDDAVNTGGVYFVDSEHITIEDCSFLGFFETAIIHNDTTLAAELWIKNCHGTQDLTTGLIMSLIAQATGGMINSHWAKVSAADVAEATFMTIPASTIFGIHLCTVMNDGAGGNRAAEIAIAT